MINKLSTPELKRYARTLREKLPENEIAISNNAIITDLGWTKELYWQVRNYLIDQGEVEKGRGRGGTIKKLPKDNSNREDATYTTLAEQLFENWGIDNDYNFSQFFVEITGSQGSKKTGGKWTRPDVVFVGVKKYSYVPGTHLEVVTFEVKAKSGIDISAVHESLAQNKFAHKSYVLIVVPDYDLSANTRVSQDLEKIIEEATRHEIGVILVDDVTNYRTWDIEVEAIRHEPDPEMLNNFIAKQITEENRRKVEEWCKL